jgi:hypothetical protein
MAISGTSPFGNQGTQHQTPFQDGKETYTDDLQGLSKPWHEPRN